MSPIFDRLRKRGSADTKSAAAEPASPPVRSPELSRKLAEIDQLSDENRGRRDPEREAALRHLRHLAGIEVLQDAGSNPRFAEPAAELPSLGAQSHVPEVSAEELTPGILRGAILSSGCLLVRGLISSERATGLADGIENVMTARSEGGDLYDELEPEEGFQIIGRPLIEEGGGVLAVDSPPLLFEMLELFREAGLRSLVEEYLGEPPAISAEKCTLRKATADVGGAWHQDGRFLGSVRTLNVWLALSRCGDVAPSMDIVPRRLDELVAAGEDGAAFWMQVSQEAAEQAAGEVEIVRPIFDPGDALLFDDLFLHQTGSDPEMPNPRYAIESWFFGASAFPGQYVPIAL